jgi:WD40 repeat protein
MSSLAAFLARREVFGGGGRRSSSNDNAADAADASGLAATQFRARRALPLWPADGRDHHLDDDDLVPLRPAAPTAIAVHGGPCSSTTRLAVADECGRVGVFSLADGGTPVSWRAHNNLAFDVQWAQGGRALLTASADRCIKLWDAGERPGKMLAEVCNHQGAIKAARAWGAGDGGGGDGPTLVASCSRDGSVNLYDLRSSGANEFHVGLIQAAHPMGGRAGGGAGGKRPRARAPEPGVVSSLAFLPGGGGAGAAPPPLLATAGNDGVVRLWDLRCLSSLLSAARGGGSAEASSSSRPSVSSFNRRACLAAVRGNEALPKPWLPAPPRPAGARPARALASLAASGGRLVASSVTGEHYLYDAAAIGSSPGTGLGAGLLAVLAAPHSQLSATAVRMAYDSSEEDGGGGPHPPFLQEEHLRLPHLARDHCAAAAGVWWGGPGDGTPPPPPAPPPGLFANGAPLGITLPVVAPWWLAQNNNPPSGPVLPSEAGGGMTPAPGACTVAPSSSSACRSFYVRACWSPDGRCVAAGTPEGALLLFDVSGVGAGGGGSGGGAWPGVAGLNDAAAAAPLPSRAPVAVLGAHQGEVTGVAWSESGELVTSGDDRRLLVWQRDDEAPRWRQGCGLGARTRREAAAGGPTPAQREPATPLAAAAAAAAAAGGAAIAVAAAAPATIGPTTTARRRLRQSRIPEALRAAAAAATARQQQQQQQQTAAAEGAAVAAAAAPLGNAAAPPQAQAEEDAGRDADEDGRRCGRDQQQQSQQQQPSAPLRRALTFGGRRAAAATGGAGAAAAGGGKTARDSSFGGGDVVSDTCAGGRDDGAGEEEEEQEDDLLGAPFGPFRSAGGGGGPSLSLGDFVPCSLQPFGVPRSLPSQYSQQQQQQHPAAAAAPPNQPPAAGKRRRGTTPY